MKELKISEIISKKRREKEVTQDELAAHIGVSKASVSKWETGRSYPDIALLPTLASYFGVSIDALMCYTPQLGAEEIKAHYARLSTRFAQLPFEEAVAECEALVKRYYACHPFLLEMAQLYLNHAPLAGTAERKNDLYAAAMEMCDRITLESKDAKLLARATVLKAFCSLTAGDAAQALAVLGEDIEPHIRLGTIVSQAHIMLGDADKAKEVAQSELYQDLMGVFSGLLAHIQTNLSDYEVAYTAYCRAESLCEIFNMRWLNPNNMALLYVTGAHAFQAAGKAEEAIDALEKYVEVCVHDFFPFEPRGDAFFDRIEPWLKANTGTMPRSETIVKESMLNDVLLNPVFDGLHDNPRFMKLLRTLRNFIEAGKGS